MELVFLLSLCGKNDNNPKGYKNYKEKTFRPQIGAFLPARGSLVVYCATRENKFILRVKLMFFPSCTQLFFPPGGQKMDLFAPYGAIKRIIYIFIYHKEITKLSPCQSNS